MKRKLKGTALFAVFAALLATSVVTACKQASLSESYVGVLGQSPYLVP